VLDKDNDLDVAQLARANAEDVLRVQPEGPYLLGGHSYGGCVAMEVAMLLEAWGHDVGLVLVGGGQRAHQAGALAAAAAAAAQQPRGCDVRCLGEAAASEAAACLTPRPLTPDPPPPPVRAQIMDTPRPEQVRTMQPGAEACSDGDALELIEMILGALGRDAIGLGASSVHPRESDEWKGMSMQVGSLGGRS
jgi:pimeloyl-ACP methyl ester carboxylesterase